MACAFYTEEQLHVSTRAKSSDMMSFYRLLWQGFNSVLFMVRSQEYMHALHCIVSLKDIMSRLPHVVGEKEGRYPES